MKKIIISGGSELAGEITIGGSKNSVVALIPAAVLARGKVKIYNYPKISDVEVLTSILNDLNVTAKITPQYLEIDSSNIRNTPLINEKMGKLRASYYFMGALLALFNGAVISQPGGCYLGPRPIDLHLNGFRLLGADVRFENDLLRLHADKLTGNRIFLDFPSVGATVNIMLASVFAEGETVIGNAAKEPEIADVASLLNKMGADITGAGSDIIRIRGVKSLTGTEHAVIPDRIEAGTYILFGVASGKEVIIKNADADHLNSLLGLLNEAGAFIETDGNKILIRKSGLLYPVHFKTSVYPGFPTDLQQIVTALLTKAFGQSTVTETIFSERFKNCDDLIKMGADIKLDNTTALIAGPVQLKGCEVTAGDLRGGASLILAGLIAKGVTTITNVEHIYRGYEDIIPKLKAVHADISEIDE